MYIHPIAHRTGLTMHCYYYSTRYYVICTHLELLLALEYRVYGAFDVGVVYGNKDGSIYESLSIVMFYFV